MRNWKHNQNKERKKDSFLSRLTDFGSVSWTSPLLVKVLDNFWVIWQLLFPLTIRRRQSITMRISRIQRKSETDLASRGIWLKPSCGLPSGCSWGGPLGCLMLLLRYTPLTPVSFMLSHAAASPPIIQPKHLQFMKPKRTSLPYETFTEHPQHQKSSLTKTSHRIHSLCLTA